MFPDERPGRLRQNPLVRNPIKRCWRAWGNGVIALTANAMEGMREIGDMPDRADAPVIMLTAIEDKNSVPEGIALGIRDYILKPFAPDDLLNRIRRVLDTPPERRTSGGRSGGSEIQGGGLLPQRGGRH